MYPAIAAGEVDVISAYTSDGRIAQYDLVVLDDPKHAIPPYDAILLISPKRADDAAFIDALRPLIDAINVETDARRQCRAPAPMATSPDGRALDVGQDRGNRGWAQACTSKCRRLHCDRPARALLDPRHHVAQLGADLLDRVLRPAWRASP